VTNYFHILHFARSVIVLEMYESLVGAPVKRRHNMILSKILLKLVINCIIIILYSIQFSYHV